ncbi:MAG: 30S ribosome-binding factor RbfA [Anaerolineae bacterium]|nr:30S ribosome-binding factor RbfA [Anaerolineae bacterium]NUQ04716.1 30S ribosome-binding factor RbfA [Anaerolineae bacterium]
MPYKQERVSGRIRKILSTLIFREVADPRLAGITVTDVEIDAELMYATVYVNAMGEEEREPEVMIGLEHAKGFLRREVAHRLRLRRAPVLTFKWDASLERGERISHLLSELDIPAEETSDEDADTSVGAADDEDVGGEERD